MQTRLHEAGIRHDVSSRRKDFASFARKAIEKARERPFEDIHDLAGVRVIVPFFDLRTRAGIVIERYFEASKREDTADRYQHDRLGYRGLHYEVQLREADLQGAAADLRRMIAEVQVQTRAEAAWAEAGHDLTYKPRVDPPTPTKRRITRLVALVELFDEQMGRAQQELLAVDGFKEGVLLSALERQFLPLARRDFDRQLSMVILEHLQNAYEAEEIEAFDALLERFVNANRDLLRQLLSQYATDHRHFLLFQPESLAVFERLDQAPAELVRAWDAGLAPDLLDSLAAVWGRPLAVYRGQP